MDNRGREENKMKITYTFDSIEDKDDEAVFAQSGSMHSVLHDLSQELRNCRKHGKPTQRDLFWEERFWELMKDNDVEIL